MAILLMYRSNTHYLRLTGLAFSKTGVMVNDATVTATMTTPTGTSIAEVTNLSLAQLVGTDGTYEGLIAGTFNPANIGDGYKVTITATRGSDKVTLVEQVRVDDRQA